MDIFFILCINSRDASVGIIADIKKLLWLLKPDMTPNEPQRVTKRCRLSLLTNSALVYESKCGGGKGGGDCGVSANEYTGAQINFGDLPLYLTYDWAPILFYQSWSWMSYLYCVFRDHLGRSRLFQSLHATSNAGVFLAYLDKPALKLKNCIIVLAAITALKATTSLLAVRHYSYDFHILKRQDRDVDF